MQRIHVTIRALNHEDSVLYFPPEAFGPFRVLHQIGAGTLGPVFRAYEPGRDRLVAVKVFRLALDPEQSAALVGELKTLVEANLTHPGIAAPILGGLDHGAPYLAQEYAVGDSLDVVLRERGPLPLQDVAALVTSLAAALDHAAERGVNHGALHLRDILIGSDTARLTGLGIGSALAKIGARVPARPAYAPAHGVSDVYSLGAIAFEAATGKRVSPDNLAELEAMHGALLRAAFERALAVDSDVRLTRATPFAEELLRALGKPGAPAETGGSVAPFARAASMTPVVLTVQGDPLDRVIDLAPRQPFEFDPVDFAQDSRPRSRLLDDLDADAAEPERRWPLAAAFVGFAIVVALVAAYFLRQPADVVVADAERGVDSTVVDLPAADKVPPRAPGAAAAPGASSATSAPGRPGAPIAASTPSPLRSRPASGAVLRAQTGSMLIRSSPADADVLVNGSMRGKTPLALRDLPLGSYTIRVARDGYDEQERTLQLTARRPTASATINLRSEKTGPGGLNVQSRPAGARVFVNNQLAGSTPLALSSLPAGPATVRIELDGYQPWTTTVRVGAGAETRVAASLERQ